MVRRFLVTFLSLGSASVAASTLSGAGRPIDGDSLMVGQQEVRLHGIDAPELAQTCTRDGNPWGCGRAAADELAKLIAGQPVSCISLGTDQYGRTLGQCRAGDTDLNRAMVALGYALAYRRYSTTYVSAEESAKLAKRGIWSGSFELPSETRHAGEDYRIEKPTAAERSSARLPVVISPRGKTQLSGGNCRIKGNHSRKGELIYHLPGMPYYAETRAEQMFCTEAQARAAGYRRSRADQHR
jgi:endonuclease YncB( thermonuclease family)